MPRKFQPILGTIVKGEYKDFKFVLKSTKEIMRYFNVSNVYKVLRDEIKTHKNCTFEKITEEESKKYKVKITKKMVDTVK